MGKYRIEKGQETLHDLILISKIENECADRREASRLLHAEIDKKAAAEQERQKRNDQMADQVDEIYQMLHRLTDARPRESRETLEILRPARALN